ncbi:uncharacterized protein [Drosophila virilis]|uniref:Single domain-containing protein n=1 Tax=Drosophila virilis TaxID=7244 RepID=A0A0Q9W3M0_DROVI|nr:uncharacterized protein LOC6625295 isoform X2 [Drosophila virilis]KRF79690.1 uncharacterized protein Dvir_GJ21779 [Drosophila virilis]
MKHICEIYFIIFGLVCSANALVHMVHLGKGVNGCITAKGEVKVGEEVPDEKTCGIFVCLDKDGNGVYQFCQKPVSFANCKTDLVNTKGKFPDCCWQCVEGVAC